MKINRNYVLMAAFAMFGFTIAGCSSNSKPNNQESGEPQYANEEIAGGRSEMNTNWRYSQDEDKLNGTKNYYAEVLSTDGRLQFGIADIDLTGSGHHTTVFAFDWFDETLPSWSGKSMIGLKFPGDTQWRKIPVSSKGGHSATFDIMPSRELVELLSSSKGFTLLHLNEEFEFRPNAPLNWSHGENSTQKEERIEEETECDTLSASD